jgi:RNA polymerase sigma-70 factor (family 1)
MTNEPFRNEFDLQVKIAAGDQLAFKKVYDTYFNKTYAFAFHVLHSKELAEEVVQEVMLRIWQMGEGLLEVRNLEGYLKMLAKRRAIDLLRRQELERRTTKESQVDWQEDANDTEEAITLNETRKILNTGISLLPHQQRVVYQLCHEQGLKYEQVAEQLNISPETVHSHMKRALKFLRLYVQENTDITILLILFKLM